MDSKLVCFVWEGEKYYPSDMETICLKLIQSQKKLSQASLGQ